MKSSETKRLAHYATVNGICVAAGLPEYSYEQALNTYFIIRGEHAFWALQFHPDITPEALYLTVASTPDCPPLDSEFLLDMLRTVLKLGFNVLIAETKVPAVRNMLKRLGFEVIGTHGDKTNHILFFYKLPDIYLKRLSDEVTKSSSTTSSPRTAGHYRQHQQDYH